MINFIKLLKVKCVSPLNCTQNVENTVKLQAILFVIIKCTHSFPRHILYHWIAFQTNFIKNIFSNPLALGQVIKKLQKHIPMGRAMYFSRAMSKQEYNSAADNLLIKSKLTVAIPNTHVYAERSTQTVKGGALKDPYYVDFHHRFIIIIN